jgi:sortase A
MATPARTTPASASPATPYRTIAPTPPVPVSPETTGSPSPPRGEIDAESKVVPVIKAGLPQGPRKPPAIRIIIPSIALDVKVIELGTYVNQEGETVWETAPYVVGHHKGTANPGEPGNVVLSGHISSIREGAIFKRLPEVEVRDAVILVTDDRNYIYQVVDKKTVEPTDIGVMFSSGEKLLTLITCVPDGVYTHRLVITARQI